MQLAAALPSEATGPKRLRSGRAAREAEPEEEPTGGPALMEAAKCEKVPGMPALAECKAAVAGHAAGVGPEGLRACEGRE